MGDREWQRHLCYSWVVRQGLSEGQLSNRALTILESEPRGIYRNDVPEEGASAKALGQEHVCCVQRMARGQVGWSRARGVGEEAGEGRK